MIFSSMVPTTVVKTDWSQLLGVGVAFIFIGLIMVMVNRIITAREEEELSKYVKQRLCRTRSGVSQASRAGEGEAPAAVSAAGPIPEIVAPSPELPPSAMKGASGHPPRSPKDKVTFVLDSTWLESEAKEAPREGESLRPMASPVPAAASPVASPPTSPLPTLAVMEGDSESDSEGGQSEGAVKLRPAEGTSIVSLVCPSPSPTSELHTLLPHPDQRGSRRKIY